MIYNTANRYGSVAIFLHWLMAALIIGMLILGLYMVRQPINPNTFKLYSWHKEFGVLIFILACLRLVWRLNNVIPTLPDHMPLYQKFLAHASHYVLYLFLFLLPLSGWLISSASGISVSFFGLFTLPNIIEPNENIQSIFSTIHEFLAYGLIATLVVHMGAALFHHFIYKDTILRRMLPSFILKFMNSPKNNE